MRFLGGFFLVLALAGQEPVESRVRYQGKEIVYFHAAETPGGKPRPLLVFLHPDPAGGPEAAQAAWRQWQPAVASFEWRLVVPWAGSTGPAWSDRGVKSLEAVVEDARRRFPVDPARIYLAGQLDGASQVFYAVSRAPDLWATALAIGGTPKIAIDTNRLYGVNTSLVPLLWIVPPEQQKAMAPLRAKLAAQDFNIREEAGADVSVRNVLEFLARHEREPFPVKVDCETGNPAFGRCYWIEITKFDPTMRNDVLASTRVPPGSGAYLDVGGFGYDPGAPGPGVLVGWLPENYKGPLMLNDRIVSVGGREIRDGQHYARMMEDTSDEKSVGIVILRNGKRQRIETRILIPRREEMTTARIQAEYLPEYKEIQVVSRGVAGIRIQAPGHWTPGRINWNGADAGTVDQAGCWAVDWDGKAAPCGM